MIQRRLFLVGYPRSGTTLLQSLIATQPGIASFPESHFLERVLLLPRYQRFLRWDLVSPSIRHELDQRFSHFLAALGDEKPTARLPRRSIWLKDYVAVFARLLDELTLAQGKTIWLEKTPGHLYQTERLARYVRDAKFIHLIRRGVDAVSSYYAVTHTYTDPWRERSLESLAVEWQQAVQTSLQQHHKPNHLLVRYEALVDDPAATIRQICQFIGTPFLEEHLQEYPQRAAALSLPNEPWKAEVQQPIANRNGRHFYRMLNEQQRDYLLQAIAATEELLAIHTQVDSTGRNQRIAAGQR